MANGRGRVALKLGLTVALAGALLAVQTPSAVGTDPGWFNRTERCVLKRINAVRSRNGLRPLRWDTHLGFVARRHARTLARSRGLWHDDGIGNKVTHWRRLGQNTGRGSRCGSIMRAFMRSSSHRSNILGRWRFVGVGTERRGGRLYVQQVFESRRDPGNVFHRP